MTDLRQKTNIMKLCRHPLVPPCLIFALTFALFAPSIHYLLVNFDDPIFIINNPIVFNGFSWASLEHAFTALHGDKVMYTPLLWVSFLLDSLLYHATPLHPWGYHLTNVLLHATNAVLLYFILLAAIRRPWFAFLAAAFWALHPLRVESVAWVTERKDTLSTLFAFLSILFYLQAWGRGRPARDGGSGAPPPSTFHFSLFTFHCGKGKQCLALLAFAAGLLSKPMLVTLPFLFLLLDYWPLNRFSLRAPPRALPRLALEKWPFFLLALLASLVTYRLQDHAIAPVSLADRLLWIPVNYFFYVSRSVWPVGLCPLSTGVPATYPWFFASCAFFLVLAGVAVILFRRCPGFLVGLLAFAGLLFPVCGIVFIGSVPVADRYSYLPSIGLAVALLALLDSCRGRGRPARDLGDATSCRVGEAGIQPPSICKTQLCIMYCALCIAIAALAAVTARILPSWYNSEALALRAEKVAPNHNLALINRFSDAFLVNCDGPASLAAADAMWTARPSTYISTLMKIRALSLAESSSAAIEFFEAHPVVNEREDADGLSDLSIVLAPLYADIGEFDKALVQLDIARKDTFRNPNIVENINAIAFWIYAVQGLEDRAAEFARLVSSMNAENPMAPENFLLPYNAMWSDGMRTSTLPRFLRLARDGASNPALLNNIAWLLATTPNSPAPPDEVLSIARQALALQPGNAVLKDTLAVALAFDGQFDEAIALDTSVADFLRTCPAFDAPDFLANVEKRIALFRARTPYTEHADAKLLFSHYTQ